MNYDPSTNPHSNHEEVDLIKLLNYFKQGIKSIFRKIWQFFEIIFQFIALLKKNWIIIVSLVFLGGLYGWYLHSFVNNSILSYEMVVKSNPVSNIELYGFSSEINNKSGKDIKSDGVKLTNQLGINEILVEPIEKEEDVVNGYFNQVEIVPFRSEQADTLYYQAFEMADFRDKMSKVDYSFQRIKVKVGSETPAIQMQERLLEYLNNLPGSKRETESRLSILKNYEKLLKRNLDNIDSILISRVAHYKNLGPAGTEQTLVNTASRGNVEADLLSFSGGILKKLYGTQSKISDYENGIQVVSNLRLINDNKLKDNPILKFALFGFILAIVVVLLLQFNKFLSRYQS